jgi:hypothetical protein
MGLIIGRSTGHISVRLLPDIDEPVMIFDQRNGGHHPNASVTSIVGCGMPGFVASSAKDGRIIVWNIQLPIASSGNS